MAGVSSHGRAIPSRRVQVLSTPATRPRVVAPLAIVAFAALLRFVFLDDQSYWLDEAITVRTLELDFSQMLDRVYDNESTPPLYYVVAWALGQAVRHRARSGCARCRRWPAPRSSASPT